MNLSVSKHALLIFAAAFGLRFLYVLKTGLEPGLAEVTRAAIAYAQKGFIGDVYSDSSGLSSHVSPIYPIALGSLYKFFGIDNALKWKLPQIMSITAASLCMALMPLLALKLGLGARSGLAAGWFLALAPLHFWLESSGSWEQPYAGLVLLWLCIESCRLAESAGSKFLSAVRFGLALGISALINPAVFFVGCVLAMVVVVSANRGAAHSACMLACVFAVCSILCAPWTVRNWIAFGRFIPLRGNFGLELRAGNNPDSDGKTFETRTPEEFEKIRKYYPISNPEEASRLAKLGETEYMRSVSAEACDYIKNNPGRFVFLSLKRAAYFLFPPPHMFSSATGARKVKAGILCAVSALGLAGIASAFAIRLQRRWFLAAAILGSALPYMFTHVSVRYRYPAHCMLALSASWFVLEFAARKLKSSSKTAKA